MNRLTKIKITELNPHVICVLCGGYYINATTIVECLHSFCRTCITRYLETSKYCPVCDVMVHKTRPLEYIRSDKTLQDLVYKLVPGLYKSEMKRRREYYAQHEQAGIPHPPSEDRGTEFHDRIIYTEDEKISLSLELCAEGIPFKTPSSIHGHNGPENIKISDVRYLSCPAAFSVGNLKKFIRMKFDLKLKYEIDVFHTAEPLPDYYTLMDIAYIYTWTRRAPLRLYYTVFECKIPKKIPEPICRETDRTVDTENIPVLVKQDKNGFVRSKHEVKKKENKKRKLPDGPDDIFPEFEDDKPTLGSERRKDTSGVRKRPKKTAKTVIDSSVMEAMSESEEQLAKLTLDCSNDLGAISVDTGGESSSQSDSVETENNRRVDDETVNKSNNVQSTMLANDPLVNNNKTNDLSDAESKSKSQISPGSISLSLFQPLNVSDCENAEEKVGRENVFDFVNDNPSKNSDTYPKPRCGPGRKKRNDKDEKKSVSVKRTKGQVTGKETSKTIPGNHPGIEQIPKKKKPGPKKKTETLSNSAVQKEKKTDLKKAKDVKTDTGERVKRKYVRKVTKEALSENTTKEAQSKNKKAQPNSAKSELKKSKVIPEDSGELIDRLNGLDEVNKQTALVAEPQPSSDVSGRGDLGNNTDANSKLTLPDKCDTSHIDKNNSCQVQSPSTPLYGQTPKVTESNQGLPVSPNPECAENSEIDVNTDCATLFKGSNGPCTNGLDECNGTSVVPNNVSDNGALHAVVNDGNKREFSATVAVTNDDIDAKLVIDEGQCVENGYTKNTDRNNEESEIGFFRNGDLPLLCPTQDVRAHGEFQPRSPHPQTNPLGNIYTQMDPNSDQPLDLTSNVRREEYMKGKIFKTKMLKRSFPKPDLGLGQKDKINSPASNGIHPLQWT